MNESPLYSMSRRNSIDLKERYGMSSKPPNISTANEHLKIQKINFQIPQAIPNAYQQHQLQQQQQQQQQHPHQDQIDSNNSNVNEKSFMNATQSHQLSNMNSDTSNTNQYTATNTNSLMNSHAHMNGTGAYQNSSNQGFLLTHHHQQLQQQFNQQQQINTLSEKYNLIENHLNGDARHSCLLQTNFVNANAVNPMLFEDLFSR